MQLGQTLVRDAQLHAGDGALDGIDVLPVDVALGNLAMQAARDGSPRAFETEAAEQAGRADIHSDQVERAFDFVEPQIVDADHLATVDVHDLTVHQIKLRADFIGPLVELGDVDRRRAEARTTSIQAGHGLPVEEDLAAVRLDDDAGHRGIPIADGGDQVGNRSDRLAQLVAHGPADRLAQIEHVPPRRCVCGWGPPHPPVTRPRERLPPRGGRGLLSGCRRTRGWRVCRRKYWVRSPLREISSEGGLGLVEMRADTPAGTARTVRSLVRVLARGQRRPAPRRPATTPPGASHRPQDPRLRRELKYRPAVASMYQPEGPAYGLCCCILLV